MMEIAHIRSSRAPTLSKDAVLNQLLALVGAVAIAASAPQIASAADACWSKAELKYSPGEERIEQGVQKALVSPPRIAGNTVAQSPFRWSGALRRVDLPAGKKVVALTFDLCEQPHEVSGYQGGIVDFLREQNVKATFFSGGKWLLTHNQRAQQLVSDPLFEVGNHSWEHRNLRLLSGSALDDEIWNAQLAHLSIQKDLQKRAKACLPPAKTGPMTLFRFPFGACNDQSLRAVEAAGLRAIQWDISSSDPWRGQTAEKMVADVMKRVQPGSIILFHANGRGFQTDKAIPAIVKALREQGYQFATVTEMLAIPGAKPVVSQTCYDSKPGDSDRYDNLARTLAEQHGRIVASLKAARIRQPLSPTNDGAVRPSALPSTPTTPAPSPAVAPGPSSPPSTLPAAIAPPAVGPALTGPQTILPPQPQPAVRAAPRNAPPDTSRTGPFLPRD